MDGATSELRAAGYGRSGELKACAEAFARLEVSELVSSVRWIDGAWEFPCLRVGDDAWRGLPMWPSEWPEHLWERFCNRDESADIAESELLAMRAPFIAEAAMRLENEGYDCR